MADRWLPVVLVGQTQAKVVALTLDDGPHGTLTPAVIDLLEEHNARATFFLIGSRVEAVPRAILERIGANHELGNHSWEEERSALVPKTELERRVALTHEVLREFGDVRVFRPGAGWPTPKVLKVARRHGYDCVLASFYANDVRVAPSESVVKTVLRKTRPGAIIVLHEGMASRARVLPILRDVLRELERRGYRVTTVSDLRSLR